MWISSCESEVNLVHFVDHIAQEVAVDHAVDGALENLGDHIAAVAVRALERAQIGKQPRAPLPVRAHGLLLVDERDQLRPGDAIRLRRPVAPAIRRLDGGAELLARELRLLLADLLHVVEELQEHDPGEHRQPVEVAVQSLVLPHDVAAGLDDAAQLLGGGLWSFGFRFACGSLVCLGYEAYRRVCISLTGGAHFVGAAEESRDLRNRSALGNGRHFENLRNLKLRRAVLDVLLEHFGRAPRALRDRTARKKSFFSCRSISARSRRVRSGALKATWHSRSNGSASGWFAASRSSSNEMPRSSRPR